MTTVTFVSLRIHEISESRHPILNPLSAEKLRLIGELHVDHLVTWWRPMRVGMSLMRYIFPRR